MRALPLSVVLLLVGPTFGQESSEPGVLLDETKPSVYIQYVALTEGASIKGGARARRLERLRRSRMVEGGWEKSASVGPQVRFELFNNTLGAIRILTESLYIGKKIRPLTLSDGTGVLALRPREQVSPCFRIEGPSPQEPEPEGIDERPYQVLHASCFHVKFPSWIASGESVVFEVPQEFLGPHHLVTIRFDYEWERENNGGIDHEVFFDSYNLREVIGAEK